MNIDWSKAPEGSTHFDPLDRNHLKQDGKNAMMWNLMVGWVEKGWQYPDDLSTMDRLLLRPQWGGEGLPPVGALCELRCLPLGGWGKAVIKYISKTQCVWVWICEGVAFGIDLASIPVPEMMEFRLIPTAEQIAADEREAAIRQLLKDCYQDESAFALVQAGRLYDAGWRRVPSP